MTIQLIKNVCSVLMATTYALNTLYWENIAVSFGYEVNYSDRLYRDSRLYSHPKSFCLGYRPSYVGTINLEYMWYEFFKEVRANGHLIFDTGKHYTIDKIFLVCKSGKRIEDKLSGEVETFKNLKEMQERLLVILKRNGRPVTRFPAKDRNRPTLENWRKAVYEGDVNPRITFAEDYHWNHNKDKFSEGEHLYLIMNNGFVKIGRSKNVEKRMKELQTGIPTDFVCFVFYNKGFLEQTMHHCFSELRMKGEWFKQNFRFQFFIDKYHNKEVGEVIRRDKRIRKQAA